VTYRFIDISVGTETHIKPHSGMLHNNIQSDLNEHHHKHLVYLQIIRHRKILGNISHPSPPPPPPPKKKKKTNPKNEEKKKLKENIFLSSGKNF